MTHFQAQQGTEQGTKGANAVGKKRQSKPDFPEPMEGETAKKVTEERYFRKNKSFGAWSIPAVLDLLDQAHVKIKRQTDLRLPNQNMMSQQVFLNLLVVHVYELIESKGLRGFESAMREPFERLKRLVAEDMRDRPAEESKGGKGNAMTRPRAEKAKKGKTSPRNGSHTE